MDAAGASAVDKQGRTDARNRVSPYSTPSATHEVLERHGLFTKYTLGQNFLVNDDIVRKILELADIGRDDAVLEVGPGIGTLTAALLQRAGRVAAIEMDRDLPAVLADTLAPWPQRFALLQMDALDVAESDVRAALSSCADVGVDAVEGAGADPSADADADPSAGSDTGPSADSHCTCPRALPNKLVSNLPYAVAATVVLDYLQRFDWLESETVMVQKEVADRMMAKPGTKEYGAYTAKLSFYARPVGRFAVSAGNFFPPPRVESAVIRLDRAPTCAEDGRPLSSDELQAACMMADAAFATRRKTLSNSCKTFFAGRPELQAELPRIFEEAGIDPRRRGETLSKPEFVRLGLAYRAVAAKLG